MNTTRNLRLSRAIRCALGLSFAATVAMPNAALAQEEDVAELERVQVTGSRIQRTDIETATPVYVMSNEDIRAGGYQRVEDILNTLPQVEAAQTAFVSNGSTLTASVDLRGLGSSRTLVLFNGRRLPPGGVYTSAPDINQIPAAMIERVEVLTGGGSSVYGADAVAGVINFILRKDFEGIEISANWSAYQHDNSNSYMQGLMDARGFEYETGDSGFDGDATSLSVVLGGQFADGRGHATGYIDYRSVDAMFQSERDYSSCALSGAGTACGGSSTAPNPNFFITPVNFLNPDTGEIEGDSEAEIFVTLDPNSNFISAAGNVYNFAPVNYFQRPDTRYAMGAFLGYELNQNFRPYMEVNFMHDRSVAQIAESGTFYAERYLIDLDNRNVFSDAQAAQLQAEFGIPADQEMQVYVGKRNVEGGGRQNIADHTSYRFVVGTEGDLGMNWAYDASYMYSAVSSSAPYVNDFYLPRVREAIGVDGACEEPCIPYNVFTYNGVSAEGAAYVQGTGILNGLNSQEVLNAYVTGDLPITFPTASLPVAAVFGVERREEKFERIADEVFESALLAGQGGPTPSIVGGYDVSEFFTELSVPVLDSLIIDLGARYSDYSNFGGESTYKVAVDWTPISEVKIRGAYNRAIRAPNNPDLYTPQSLGLWSGTDPCAGDFDAGTVDIGEPEFTAAQCALTGVTAAQYGSIDPNQAEQYNAIFGGEPNLNPEVADTITFGVVANPFESFNFSVDYWSVEIEDAIGSIGPRTIINTCVATGDPLFCDLIERGAGGTLWRGTEGVVRDVNVNLGQETWEGIDVTAQYHTEIAGGRLNVAMVGTKMLTKETLSVPGIPESLVDCLGIKSTQCFTSPEWRHTVTGTYGMDDWSTTLRWRYIGAVDYDEGVDQLVGDGIDAQSYFDIVGQYYLGANTSFTLGINNFLDEEPPLMGGTLVLSANTEVGFYDTLGRMVFANVTLTY